MTVVHPAKEPPVRASSLPTVFRRRAIAPAAPATTMLIAACGGGSSGGDGEADPAAIAPKAASVYVVGTIRPEGDQKAAVESLAEKFGVPDPGGRISAALDKSFNDDPGEKVSFKDDIEPWLGDRMAIVVTGTQGGAPQAAGIIPSTDTGKTEDALSKDDGDTVKKTYRDVDYRLDKGDRTAAGVVGDYFVVGSETAFKAIVDTEDAGEGLDDTAQFKQVADANDDKLGFGYVDLKSLLASLNASGQVDPAAAAALRQALGGGELQPVSFGLSATQSSVTLDAEAQANKALPAQNTPDSVKDLPGDSWVAIGIPDLGKSLTRSIGQFGSGLGGQAIETAKGQFKTQTGLDLDRDVLAALGDVAIFVRGTSPLDVGGGLVIDTPDPAAANRLVAKLAPLLTRAGVADGIKAAPVDIAGARGVKITARGLPGAVNAVVKGSKLVIAYSDSATRDALTPRETLGDSAAYQQATQAVGGTAPALYVAFAPIVDLVSSTGSDNAAEVKRYLGRLTTLAVGGTTQGNRSKSKFVLDLK